MNHKKVLTIEDSIKEVLRQLGIMRTYKGFDYLTTAIKLKLDGAEINKVFYKTVAMQYGAKRQNMCSYMRVCIRRAQRINPAFLSMVMDSTVERPFPSLSKFIHVLAAWVEQHEAILVYDNKTSLGTIEWNTRSHFEPVIGHKPEQT